MNNGALPLAAGSKVSTLSTSSVNIVYGGTGSGNVDASKADNLKAALPAGEGKWLHFDYVPEEHEVRFGSADYTGRLCVIGAQLKEHELHHLFGL